MMNLNEATGLVIYVRMNPEHNKSLMPMNHLNSLPTTPSTLDSGRLMA
jgi:hypothetical protein